MIQELKYRFVTPVFYRPTEPLMAFVPKPALPNFAAKQKEAAAMLVSLRQASAAESSPVDAATRKRIDQWIADNGLNPYGDPPGAMYAGGTPLFNEATGERKDRYEYILARHPELGQASAFHSRPAAVDDLIAALLKRIASGNQSSDSASAAGHARQITNAVRRMFEILAEVRPGF